jgi:glycolate oxidase FAD binding subunit
MTDQHINPASCDRSDDIVAALHRARETHRPVYITAGGSKRHSIGRNCGHDELDVSGHRGIIDYQPEELIICARAGTPLDDIIALLQQENQTLSFEPPLFGGRATLGGTLACNLSGPSRPWNGSIRDMVLGVKMFNGRAEPLSFGGKVMKNVAGYDVSRLQAGALGTLGVLDQVCLKVLPKPEKTLTLRYEIAGPRAIAEMIRRAGEPKPLSGAFWCEGELYLRLSGAASAVCHTARQWGGESVDEADVVWEQLREMTLPYFAGDTPLWRFSISPTASFDDQLGPTLVDWGGAQRWLRGDHHRDLLEKIALDAGGHVTLFRGGDRNSEVRSPLSAVEQALQQRLKHSFDPDGILNPGRLYSWL